MAEKQCPLGICDLCGRAIPSGRWFTSERRPRLYCCRRCRNIANARIKAKERGRLLQKRYAQGTWLPHFATLTPEERREYGTRAGTVTGNRNTDAILRGERPHQDKCRRLPDEPLDEVAYQSASRKVRAGAKRSQLTPDEVNALRVSDRTRWRTRDSIHRQPNSVLIQARRAAGMTRRQLAEHLGVPRSFVDRWERYGYRPSDPAIRAAIEALLGNQVFSHLDESSSMQHDVCDQL